MPPKYQRGKPLSPEILARACELHGMGLSQREASSAVGISEDSIGRALKRAEYKKIVEDVRRQRGSMTREAASVVREMLEATDDKGEPLHGVRERGAALLLKNPDLLNEAELTEEELASLPGVVMRFPWGGMVVEDAREEGAENPENPAPSERPKPQLQIAENLEMVTPMDALADVKNGNTDAPLPPTP